MAIGTPQRVEIQKGLSGMLPLPEPTVYNRRLTCTHCPASFNIVKVTKDNQIGVLRNNFQHVVETFFFRRRRRDKRRCLG